MFDKCLTKKEQIRGILEIVHRLRDEIVDHDIKQLLVRLEKCEIALAHTTRTNEELSDVVAQQELKISKLERRVDMLMSREAEREAQGMEYVADQRPPHW